MREYEKQGLSSAEYRNIHYYLYSNYPKTGVCSHCNRSDKKRTEHAILQGRKYSKDINDYIELCPSCHRKYDYTKEMRIKFTERIRTAFASGKMKSNWPKNGSGGEHPTSKSVLKICKYTNIVLQEYDTITNASIDVAGKLTGAINNSLIGRAKTAYGFKWEYKK